MEKEEDSKKKKKHIGDDMMDKDLTWNTKYLMKD